MRGRGCEEERQERRRKAFAVNHQCSTVMQGWAHGILCARSLGHPFALRDVNARERKRHSDTKAWDLSSLKGMLHSRMECEHISIKSDCMAEYLKDWRCASVRSSTAGLAASNETESQLIMRHAARQGRPEDALKILVLNQLLLTATAYGASRRSILLFAIWYRYGSEIIAADSTPVHPWYERTNGHLVDHTCQSTRLRRPPAGNQLLKAQGSKCSKCLCKSADPKERCRLYQDLQRTSSYRTNKRLN